jgi:hypothetical protein
METDWEDSDEAAQMREQMERDAQLDYAAEAAQETAIIPTIGRIVIYTLNEQDTDIINRRRTTGGSIAERLNIVVPSSPPPTEGPFTAWPRGAQAHIGNLVSVGDEFPMVIVRVWGDAPESAVNGQVLLDGCDVYWATSRVCGDARGMWRWPSRS